MLFEVTVVISIVALVLLLSWYRYQQRIDWQIKFTATRLNKIIRCQRRDKQVVQQLLKRIYSIINKSMLADDSRAVYQALDLLKLAFGYGMIRPNETTHLMAISVAALNSKKPDVVSFSLDAFRTLMRQLAPAAVVIAINQLTLISVFALRQKQNFLAAKVVECIFYIIEQGNGEVDPSILQAAIRALKVIGIMALRRRDEALFREMNRRLSAWIAASPVNGIVAEELINMLTGWLYRIVSLNQVLLFVIIADFAFGLIEAEVLTEEAINLLIDEWANIASMACLDPHNQIAGFIIEFMFKVAEQQNTAKQWWNIIAIVGRVAKLTVSRHGLVPAFMVVHPLLECGRKMLWAELNLLESIDVFDQQLLITIVRECLIIIEYATRQNLLGSTGESIYDIFKCWVGHPGMIVNYKSVKKYCQLLVLFWLKNKRQSKRQPPYTAEFMEPILFSNSEKEKLCI